MSCPKQSYRMKSSFMIIIIIIINNNNHLNSLYLTLAFTVFFQRSRHIAEENLKEMYEKGKTNDHTFSRPALDKDDFLTSQVSNSYNLRVQILQKSFYAAPVYMQTQNVVVPATGPSIPKEREMHSRHEGKSIAFVC